MSRRRFLGATLALPVLGPWAAEAGAQGAAPAAPPPVADFFRDPALAEPVLAPSGRAVALRVRGAAGGQRSSLLVLDLDSLKPVPVAAFHDADVGHVRWLDDERLLFSADTVAPWANRRVEGGLYAVRRDGTGFRTLVAWDERIAASDVGRLHLRDGWYPLHDAGPQRGPWIHIAEPVGQIRDDVPAWRLLRVNTDTAEVQPVATPGPAFGWLLDAEGQPLLTLTAEGAQARLHLREAGGGWRALPPFERFLGGQMQPLHAGADGRILVATRSGGRDLSAVHTLDAASGELSARPLLAVNGFDLEPQVIARDDRVLGLRFLADAEVTHWLDPAMKALQAQVDARLGATANRLTPPRRGNSPWVLLTSWSDTQPARHHVLHRETQKLHLLGEAQPHIAPAAMAQTDFLRFKARDGLEIPAWLTRPRGAEGRRTPLLLWVHGGPWGRGGQWEWQPEWQFLASRGYTVLAPEFRGSTGFGWRHFQAGLRQWGHAMQDDLVDAVKWAVAQGHADAARVAVGGASYGGYAALMALARDAEVFRCGISFAGVTDLSLLYDEKWSDTGAAFRHFGLTRLVGDPVKDAAELRASSPLQRAASIRRPLLLAWGQQDTRVPAEHAERLAAALREHNPALETQVFLDEGHGLFKPANRVAFWSRAEAFLARHLGAAR